MTNDRTTAHIRLKTEELLYDIGNNAYVQADTMKTEDEHDKHQVFDITQDGNIDRVSRVMNMAFHECEAFLYPYTKREIEHDAESDDTLKMPEVYDMELSLPHGFAHGTLELLTSYIHEYMICRVLSDWMSITYPDASAAWDAKCENSKTEIHRCKNFRFNRVRRTQTPF